MDYPCRKFEKPSDKDSFTSYKNVIGNIIEAKKDMSGYLEELKKKYSFLQMLIAKYNDGKSRTFYCIIVNNMSCSDLDVLIRGIDSDEELGVMDDKERAKEVVKRIKSRADELGVLYRLRK